MQHKLDQHHTSQDRTKFTEEIECIIIQGMERCHSASQIALELIDVFEINKKKSSNNVFITTEDKSNIHPKNSQLGVTK